jgi:parvulin-like peptidyl-prolyl isomerase
MSILARLNRPWIHFIVLGFGLYYLQGVFFPAPKPVIGPLGGARIETLNQQWFKSTGRLPSAEQLDRMVTAELDRDMLFQRAIELDLHLYDSVVYQRLLLNMGFLKLAEDKTDEEKYQQALDMRLHLGDEVVKRRLIQVMEQLLLGFNPPNPPTEAELLAEFAARKDELRRPPRYSIEHVYFNAQREAEAESAVAQITQQQLDPVQALELSSPFLPGYRFTRQSPDQLARQFGSEFVENLEAANPEPGNWIGPIRSTYGLHYVWVSEMEPGRDATLDEVRVQLMRDLESRASANALQESIAAMREQYEVKK